MNILSCPLPLFRSILLALAEDRSRDVFLRVGANFSSDAREWLARELVFSLPVPRTPQQYFRVSLTAESPSNSPNLLPRDLSDRSMVGHLYPGDGRERGRLWGMVRIDEAIEPLDRLFLVGSGMYVLSINPAEQISRPFRLRDLFTPARWSRTIGALGGLEIWRRLIHLRFAVIGCGRTGSLVAATLLRMGVRQLTLIDPDVIEAHNLGEMEIVNESDLGRPKAQAIAEALQSQFPRIAATLIPIVEAVADPKARNAVKTSDVVFCCADNDAARLTTALFTTLYHKILVDIGTGIFYPDHTEETQSIARQTVGRGIASSPPPTSVRRPASRRMGADVRIILPGHGCLLCIGNLTDYPQAVEDICNHRPPSGLGRDWQQQRAGSLRSLNQIAAGLGVQMLQDLVAERIAVSTWAQLEYREDGQVQVSYPLGDRPASRPDCSLCAKAGMGDQALSWGGEQS